MFKLPPIKEYSELSQEEIKDCNLDKFQSYLKCQNLESALKVTRKGIKTKSWVGVIKYKNLHLEILPKLISENVNNDDELMPDKRSIILKNLIYMLSYTKNLQIKTSDNAKLSKEKNPFLEILIREFANSLFGALKRFTPKNYIQQEDNLNFLRGKIKFSENIRYNCVNQAKFYCEFDEFSENNILNQLFLFVSTCLFDISHNSYNKKILKFIINYYSDIKPVRFDKFKVEKIKLTRNQELFKKPFNLAKMFVEQASVDLSKNKFENITLIWDMNKLFEEFVYELIKKEIPEVKPNPQKGKRLLRNGTETRRDTKVDILLENPSLIIDTKYKKFTKFDDISSSDIYQVMTYCLLHGEKYKKAILLYPQYDESEPDISGFYINNDQNNKEENYSIDFCTINLKQKDLSDKDTRKDIIEKLKRIIDPANEYGLNKE